MQTADTCGHMCRTTMMVLAALFCTVCSGLPITHKKPLGDDGLKYVTTTPLRPQATHTIFQVFLQRHSAPVPVQVDHILSHDHQHSLTSSIRLWQGEPKVFL